MLDLLNQIELTANDLAELNYQLQLDREELATIEAEVRLQILDAKNDAGKPLYSNETARANALTLQLRQHTDYQFRLTNIRATAAGTRALASWAGTVAQPLQSRIDRTAGSHLSRATKRGIGFCSVIDLSGAPYPRPFLGGKTMYENKWAQLLETAVTTPGSILKAYTAFHQYSLLNQWAAIAQCAAREIAPGPMKTFQGWKELGRYVRKGEKAIWLCRPLTRKNEADETVVVSFHWKPYWFVLSQTCGEDVELTALPEWNAARAFEQLNITRSEFQTIDGNAQGYAKGRSVAINPVAELPHKTLLHELAHVVLGHTAEGDLADDDRTPCNLREVEAEAVALVLCESLELPGAPYCRGYIQHWLRDGQTIPDESARKILHAADVILRVGQPTAG